MSDTGDSWVRVSGAWKRIAQAWTKLSGVWKELNEIHYHVGTIPKKVFAPTIPDGIILMLDASPTNTSMGWVIATSIADNRFVKINATPGTTGGSATHTHPLNMNTGSIINKVSNDQKDPIHAHMTQSTHYHTANHTHTGTNDPSYNRYVPWTGGIEIPAGAIVMWRGVGQPPWTIAHSIYRDSDYDRLLQFGGNTGSYLAPQHSDTLGATYSGYVSSPLSNVSRDYGVLVPSYGQHRHTIAHTHAVISRDQSYPPSRGIMLYKIDEDLKTVPSGACFCYTGTGATPEGWTDITSVYDNQFLATTELSSYTMGRSKHAVPTVTANTSGLLNATRIHGLDENDAYGKPAHTHTINHSHTEASMVGSNEPLYRTFRLLEKD